jgi:hypothetical protein
MEKCDLLEVYNESEKTRLKTQVHDIDWTSFLANDAIYSNSIHDDKSGIEFGDEREDDYKKLMEHEIANTKTNTLTLDSVEEEEINIDDI